MKYYLNHVFNIFGILFNIGKLRSGISLELTSDSQEKCRPETLWGGGGAVKSNK